MKNETLEKKCENIAKIIESEMKNRPKRIKKKERERKSVKELCWMDREKKL